MALLDIEQRKEYFKALGLGEYNAENILKLQKKYMLRKSDCDGVYGTDTDNLVRHLKAVKDCCTNFAPEEFRCGCNGRHCCGYPTYMKPVELKNIQAIRTHYGKPMVVTCGVRCNAYNREVSGISNSEHKKGLAVDYYIEGVTDTLANRKANIRWISTLPNHHYTYGNGIFIETANGKTVKGSVAAPGMGNAMHTDCKEAPSPYDESGKLICDGVGGAATVKEMQRFFGTTQDGVISGQNKAQSKYYPALKAVEYGKGGSPCVKNLQKWVGTTQDGIIGEKTVKAWQKKIGVASDGIFGANSMRAWQEYLNEHDKAVYPKEDDFYKVIDVSDHQKQIDWSKVKADGIVGAIIRYADGDTLDVRFEENIKGATAVGLHIGAYIYSRAKTKAQAEKEAERLFNACKPYTLDMPLYIDLEAKGLEEYANTVAQAFLIKMKSLGGRGGVYANLNWWDNYLADTAKNYSSNPFWIAQYNDTMDYKPADRMGMWQYTSSGKVDGIKGDVDRDKCYTAYWQTEQTPQDRICSVAKEIADSGKYQYIKYNKSYAKECGFCAPIKGEGSGGNCIDFAFHCWHVVTGCKCSFQVITDQLYEKLLKVSASEAVKIVRERTGLKDVEVITDKNGIPTSKLQKGDIVAYFNGSDYVHTAIYIGNGKIADCTSGRKPSVKYGVKSYSKWKIEVAIRYTGK